MRIFERKNSESTEDGEKWHNFNIKKIRMGRECSTNLVDEKCV